MKAIPLVLLSLITAAPASAAPTIAIPKSFASHGADRTAIETVLATYTKAVSTRNEALFESLLLNRDIPFSDPAWAAKATGSANPTQNYETFRKSVFEGEPFQQRFQDVQIMQNGALAEATLVFVNSTPKDSSWGWKTLQLIRIGGKWKIASEFFTPQR